MAVGLTAWARARHDAAPAPAGASSVPGPAPADRLPDDQLPAPVRPTLADAAATPTVSTTIPVGSTPGHMEVAPGGGFAYIANRSANVLTVLDTTRNAVTGTIPVPDGGPQFIAFSPDGAHAYVSISDPGLSVNEVGVLDTRTAAFVARIPTGKRPFALVVAPGGRRPYVPNHESNLVTTIDTASNAVVGTVPVGRSPHSLVRHRTRPLLLDADYDDSTVSVTDVDIGRVVAKVPVATHPQDITLGADGRYAYLAAVDANVVQVLDTTSLTITATVPVGGGPTSVAVGPDGRHAYVTDLLDGTVAVLDVGTV